jgi:hypothetical protein
MPPKTSSIFGMSISSRIARKGELIKHLDKLHNTLADVGQEMSDNPKELTFTAKQLVAQDLLQHKDKEVKLLTVCCLVDILRVFAPDAPYSNEETVSVFRAIVNQLRAMATSQSLSDLHASKVYYILSSIATVQSCVVPVMLAQSGVTGAEEVVTAMFETIMSSAHADHPEEGKNRICIILIYIYIYHIYIYIIYHISYISCIIYNIYIIYHIYHTYHISYISYIYILHMRRTVNTPRHSSIHSTQ